MSRKNPPRLTIGPLSGRIYIVTRYTDKGNGIIDAREKYDVTGQFMAVKAEAEAKFDYKPLPVKLEPGLNDDPERRDNRRRDS